MAVGGSKGGWMGDAEVIFLGNETKSCKKPADFPLRIVEHVAANVNGVPVVCGGRHNTGEGA